MNILTEWLLESPTASLRYLTLRHLLDRHADDPDVQAARVAIMETGPIPAILAQQTEAGHWQGVQSYYTPKYTSTHWSMTLMVEFAAEPTDPRLQRGAESVLSDTAAWAVRSHSPEQQDLACFWGNLLRYVCYCGCADDARVATFVKTLVLASQARGWGCVHNGELGCAWGAARALWGLAALPSAQRSPAVESAIASGVEFLVGTAATLVRGAYPTSGQTHKHWSRLNFPLFYQADILFVLRVLAELDALDQPGAQTALDWLVERRQSNGRWRGASPYGGVTWRNLGDRADTSRWVSLHAARVLRQAGHAV